MIPGPNIQDSIERVEDSNDTTRLISSENEGTGCRKCFFLCCHPRGKFHRFVALFFMCWLSFGSYFCYDNPAALENYFKNDMNLTSTEFTGLYSAYSWPNVILCFIGGYLIDSVFGIRLGTNIYVGITLLGQIVFALGAIFNLYWLAILGRFVFGIGGESLAVGQNSYAVLWFKGKELNMVFGLQLSFARVGSAVNFLAMEPIYNWFNHEYKGAECLGIVLFVAASTCLISLICSLILGLLDKRAEDTLRRNETSNGGSAVSFRDVKYFGATFWLVGAICVSYYVAIFPFIGLGKDFFMEKFHMKPEEANRVNSLVYWISAIASPASGYLIDLTGKNIMWIAIGIISTVLSHSMLAFTYLNPYIGMTMMGISYSILAASLWPLVSLIIPDYLLGTAYGVCQAIQNAGLAIAALITGGIVDKWGYLWLEVFFIVCLNVAFLCTIFLWIADRYKDCVLNMTPGDRKRHQDSVQTVEVLQREKILDSQGSPTNQNDFMRVSSDYNMRNRYLYRIGAPLPPNFDTNDLHNRQNRSS